MTMNNDFHCAKIVNVAIAQGSIKIETELSKGLAKQ